MLFSRLIIKHPTGRTAMREEDLALKGIDGGDVFRLGSKLVLPKKWIDRFHSKAVRGRQLLEQWTQCSPSSESAYGGTWRPVSPEAIDHLEAELAEVREAFEADRDEFLSDLDGISEEQRAAWQGGVAAMAAARAERGERIDIEALMDRTGAAYDAAFERIRRKLADGFQWDLVYCTIAAPNLDGQTSLLSSETLRASIYQAREKFEEQMAVVRHEITQAIRVRVAEKLQSLSDRVVALRERGAGLSANTLRALATELDLARITNPFGDADMRALIERFQQEWLEGRTLSDVTEGARTDGTQALKLQASVDRMLGQTQGLLDAEEKALAARTMGAAATEGRRRIR